MRVGCANTGYTKLIMCQKESVKRKWSTKASWKVAMNRENYACTHSSNNWIRKDEANGRIWFTFISIQKWVFVSTWQLHGSLASSIVLAHDCPFAHCIRCTQSSTFIVCVYFIVSHSLLLCLRLFSRFYTDKVQFSRHLKLYTKSVSTHFKITENDWFYCASQMLAGEMKVFVHWSHSWFTWHYINFPSHTHTHLGFDRQIWHVSLQSSNFIKYNLFNIWLYGHTHSCTTYACLPMRAHLFRKHIECENAVF